MRHRERAAQERRGERGGRGRNALYIQRGHDLFIRDRTSRREGKRERARERERDCAREDSPRRGERVPAPKLCNMPFRHGPFLEE